MTIALLCLLGACSTTTPKSALRRETTTVIHGRRPLAVLPEAAKWRALRTGMTEAEVMALLGQPRWRDARPAATTEPGVIQYYAWNYGGLTFQTFNSNGADEYLVYFHEGRVAQIIDPWNGKISLDGRPTVPELLLPEAGQKLNHYPRFMDFRWQPASGKYPMEYEVVIQMLSCDQNAAEHLDDYVGEQVDALRQSARKEGLSQEETEASAASLRSALMHDPQLDPRVLSTSHILTHDVYLPFNWGGMNTGRWRIRAINDLGKSDWTPWRYFQFLR